MPRKKRAVKKEIKRGGVPPIVPISATPSVPPLQLPACVFHLFSSLYSTFIIYFTNITLYYIILHYILYYIILYCIILHYSILYYFTLPYISVAVS